MEKPSCRRRAPATPSARRMGFDGRHVSTAMLTSACLITPVMAQADDAAMDTLTITASNLYENVGYTRRTINAGTRMNLSPK
ncbi:hypothetical protein [Kushneria avicenniae]|uniref:hypothetical protein n=1 Tax=Kushneria avicenniae TaxID=402385 RepID=UPI001113D3F1|nr:hypothetical protein [Kushneria avicenniae]